MIASTHSHPSAPCGCGGAHGSTSTSGCGCGCGCGTADCRDGVIARPLFFAGQLLTEEDLQALTAYVIAKSRLHNRSFFGEGVACGFEVVSHPCGGGKIIVRPGHALDCCGNDIVLTAAQTLDVNALVRDLRKRLQGGIDCGDPCADPAKGEPRQSYCLFVNYCETSTDPVSAFVTDEPCGTAACEPTRVREGLRFELRCRDRADPSQDALCRIANCLGDAKTLGAILGGLTTLHHVIELMERGIELERQNKPYDVEALRASLRALQAATKPDPPTGHDVRNVAASLDILRVHLDRLNKAQAEKPPELTTTVPFLLRAAAQEIVSQLAMAAPTHLEKAVIRRAVKRMEKTFKDATGTDLTLWTLQPDINPTDIGSELDELLCALFTKLRERLDSTPDSTVCGHDLEVRRLSHLCPVPSPAREFPLAIDLARQLRDATWHSLQECICPALLPPCPECHDLGVQLACLEVEKCEVVQVCNLERTIVPTPVALRHWLPFHRWQQLAAAFCCQDLGHLDLTKLCPSTPDFATLALAFRQLRELILENEPLGQPFFPALSLLALPSGPAPTPSAPVAAAVEPAEPAAVRRLETEHKKTAAELEKAQGDLEALRHALDEQTAKNADLEKRLKALEGRKKS